MATENLPGEQPGQLLALLERWQTSLDLHARYSALDDARYNQRKAAQRLSLTYHQFRGLLRKYKLLDEARGG